MRELRCNTFHDLCAVEREGTEFKTLVGRRTDSTLYIDGISPIVHDGGPATCWKALNLACGLGS
jgi:hypothetical protein